MQEARLGSSLIETFLSRVEGTAEQAHDQGDGWGFPAAVLDNNYKFKTSQEGFVDALQRSRTFSSPDCADAMANMMGVNDLFIGLRGSLMRPMPSESSMETIRSRLRQHVRSAWSQEALKRGVLCAKGGDVEQALSCYSQALDLNDCNTDALVARGAALANTQQWQRASDDLERALQLHPGHQNAIAYLSAVKVKAASCGIVLRPTNLKAENDVQIKKGKEVPEQPQQQQIEFMNTGRGHLQGSQHQWDDAAKQRHDRKKHCSKHILDGQSSMQHLNCGTKNMGSGQRIGSGSCDGSLQLDIEATNLADEHSPPYESSCRNAGTMDLQGALDIVTKHYKRPRNVMV